MFRRVVGEGPVPEDCVRKDPVPENGNPETPEAGKPEDSSDILERIGEVVGIALAALAAGVAGNLVIRHFLG